MTTPLVQVSSENMLLFLMHSIRLRKNHTVYLATHCMSAESGGMYSPPAAFMDAVDPVAVHTHMPDDQTLNQSRAASPGNRKDA